MNVTRSDVLNALGMAVLMGFAVALVAALLDNPVVPTGIAAAIGGVVGRLGFYSSRNLKGMSGPKPEPLQGHQLD